ncbi:MAG: hypothetical protein HRF47_18390 [Chloroflexota bacterium]|jgi:L-serine deaminase
MRSTWDEAEDLLKRAVKLSLEAQALPQAMETKQQAQKLQAELEKHLAPTESPEALETVLARVFD